MCDNDSDTIKFGLIGNNSPKAAISTIVGTPREEVRVIFFRNE